MSSPTITVTLDGKPAAVTFDVGTLLRIEEADGRSPFQIAEALVEKLNPTPAAGATANGEDLLRNIRVRDAVAFVGPCLGVPPYDVKATPAEIMPAYLALAGAFIKAVGQLAGGGEEAGAATVPTGDGSAPGAVSSSA